MNDAPAPEPRLNSAPCALIVDDDPGFVLGLAELVKREGFEVARAGTLKQAREEIATNPPHILLVDLQLPDGSGLDLLDGFEPLTAPEVVLITGHASVDTAVDALRRGVADYLTKPVDFARVKMALGNVTRALEMRGEIINLRGELRKLGRFGPLIGASPAMQSVYDLIARVARTEASVLITGETGTGKELVAETIHALSRRSKEAFLPLNCGAVSANLIESELFGHERGSFTGADRLHKGYFERAHKGTLFLDEITEMPTDLQVRLLRALEAAAVTRVGGSERIKVDVRIVAATSRRVEEAVAAGKLREDLFYRLNVVTLSLPALRDRRGDIPLLGEHFLAKYAESLGERVISAEAMDRLMGYDWPANVRELENVVQRAMVMASTGAILPEHLPIGPVSTAAAVGTDASLEDVIERKMHECVRGLRGHASANLHGLMVGLVEKPLLRAVMRETKGNQVRAAQLLGINRNTLRKKLKEHGIDPDAV